MILWSSNSIITMAPSPGIALFIGVNGLELHTQTLVHEVVHSTAMVFVTPPRR